MTIERPSEGLKMGKSGLLQVCLQLHLQPERPFLTRQGNKSGLLSLSQQKGLSLPRDLTKSELSFDFRLKRRLRLSVGR